MTSQAVTAMIFVSILFSLLSWHGVKAKDNLMSRVEAAHAKGQIAIQSGDYTNAVLNFKFVVKNMPDLLEGYANLAIVYEQMRDWENAFDVYTAGMQRFGSKAPLLPKHMCNTLLRLLQEGPALSPKVVPYMAESAVKEICYKSRKWNKDDPAVHSSLGDMHTLLVEWKDAAENYHQALALYKKAVKNGIVKNSLDIARTYGNLANSNSRAGNVPEALEAAKQSLELRPDESHNVYLVATIGCTGSKFSFKSRITRRRAQLLAIAEMKLKDVSCPTGSWTTSFTWPEIAEEDGATVTLINPQEQGIEYGINDIKFGEFIPFRFTTTDNHITPYPTSYHERSIYLINISNVFIGGPSGIMHRNCVVYSGGHSEDARIYELAHVGGHLETIKRLKGTYVHVLSQNLRNYYHFMCESMPRLLATYHYLRQHDPVALGSVRWLVPDLPWVKEMLDLLGLSNLKVGSLKYTLTH